LKKIVEQLQQVNTQVLYTKQKQPATNGFASE
jgi:hypothetical protein